MRDTIEKHIKENFKDYLILFLILMIGIIVGVISINNANENQKQEASTYINSFTSDLKNGSKIDYGTLLANTIKDNIKLVCIIAFLSLSIFGAIGVYAIIGYKGFCMGYTISSIIIALGSGKGFLCSLTLMLMSKIILIPAIFFLSVSSLKIYKMIINNDERSDLKRQLVSYIIKAVITLVVLIMVAFIETYLNTNLFLCILKYL